MGTTKLVKKNNKTLFNFYLNTRKNNVVIKKFTDKNFSLNGRIQTTYTTKLKFCICMTKNKKKLNIKCFKIQHIFIMISFMFYFYFQKFELEQ